MITFFRHTFMIINGQSDFLVQFPANAHRITPGIFFVYSSILCQSTKSVTFRGF